ncbi:uncharacterized protein [Apostichopus japonicus]|uniref:uncharacterized protein isoform X2 n=1 Tax=Stichopus japonicus TaxID=307972 RepID=UPI003AB45FE8
MEADSTSSSSLQQKEMDDKSINEGSQISTSNQDNLSKIEEPQATQREVHEEGEKDVYETLRSDDQNVSKVAELTGEDSQSSQREDDISKEQETHSYESVHSDENLKDDITKAIPGKVTSVDNSIKDKVSEEAGEMSKVEKSPGANEMEGNDNIESKAENEPGSIAQVSDSSVPDVSGPLQTRQVEGAVSSTCSFEGTKKSGVESLQVVGVHFKNDVATSIQTENTSKENIEDKTDGMSPTSITKDVKDDSLPSESTSATSKSDQIVDDSQGTEQEEPHLALPDIDREVREQFQVPTNDRVLLRDTDKDKEATITERSESENPTVESQLEHEAMSVADEVEDEEDSTKGAEPEVTPSSDSQAVGDISADDSAEMAVTDTGKRDANKVQENEQMDTTGGESKQEDAERDEKECEGKKNADEKEGEDNQINQEEDTERQEEPIEPESTSEQKESITAAGDEEDGSKDKGPEDEKDQNGDEEEEAKLADEKEGEADGKGEDDEDEQEEEAEGKSERRRTSPIRCFDESSFTVEKLFEYQWPQDHGEFFFVQEQISEYLGVTSFKRKYPALERRLIAVEERRFLKDKGVVTEEQVTLGLTALKADEVYDVMQKDFPDKYSDYARLIQQRQREAVKNQHKEYGTPAVDSAKMKNYIKKAVRQAAEYNASLMREKREERQYYLDLQTMLIHCPNTKMKKLTKEQSKPGPYPVAVIPGQFQNYYKSYTPEELKYLPVNTAIYGPMATQKQSDIAPSVPPGSEVSSDDEDLSLATIEPPFDHERITPGFFKDQMQSVLPTPPRETPMISLQPAPMVSLAPPPPVTQVLSQLLQQKAIIPPKHIQYVPKDIPDAICGLCLKDRDCNRKGEPEELVHCSQCDNSGHPSCLEMSAALVCAIKTYPWQCMECKTCTLCGDPTHEDKMMFCDECDRGYHTFCVGLTELPTGLWACASCRCVPPARPLPPPPIEVMPAPLNGTPEAVTPAPRASLDPDTPTNGLKRPAEPLPTGEEKEETVLTEIKTERTQAPTPPPAKKRHTKKNKATPAKS